jgi:hypothetical protein
MKNGGIAHSLQSDKHASEPESENAERRDPGDRGRAGLGRRRVHVFGRVVRGQRDADGEAQRDRAALRPHQRGGRENRGHIPEDDQRHLGARLRRQQPHQVLHPAEARSTRAR